MGALALYAALAAVFTYPLAFNLDRVNGSGDPAVQVWSMAWISNALFKESGLLERATLFRANIFHPTDYALTYTDLLLPSALFTAPFYFLTGNALVGANTFLLLTYVLSGYTVFLLAGRLMRGLPYALPAALFAGAVYALCPYRHGHLTQLNSMTTFWLPLILLFMHRYLEDGRRPRDLFLVGLCFTLNALSGLYYGVFAGLMMAAFFVFWSLLNREWPRMRDFLYGVPLAAVFGAALLYFLGPYLAASDSAAHGRSLETVIGGSVIPAALLVSPPQSWLLGWTPDAFGIPHGGGRPLYELTLYPGIAVVALAVASFLTRDRRWNAVALYALVGLTIFVLSLGPQASLGGQPVPLPYRPLYEFVPGFSNLRVPARMWILVMLCLSVLAAFGLRVLMQRLGGKRAALAFAAISLFAALEFLPTLPVDRFIDRGPQDLSPAYAYLAEEVEEPEEAVVAEVPFASPADPFRETSRMYRSTHGWWRLVNGYGSYFPEGYGRTRNALNALPAPEGLAELERLGVDYVVVHPDEYEEDGNDGEAALRSIEEEPALERVAGNDGEILFRFTGR